jgi:hypothetical protein
MELPKPNIVLLNRKERRKLSKTDSLSLTKEDDVLLKNIKKIEKLLGVKLEDLNFSQKFLENQCVKVTDTFSVHKDVYQQYLKVQEYRIPCGYIWFDITDLKEEMIGLKNGQTSTGNVKGRVTSFETRGTQILLDILEDDVFKEKGYDQKLNLEIESDYYESYKIEVENSKTVRTRENILVPRALIFDFPQLKRNTLSRILNKTISKRIFHTSVSHEECLQKLTTNSEQQFFLLDCVMRFGKSFIYYEYLKREWVDNGKVGIHTVFCHDTKTVDGWLEKVDIYYTDLFDCVLLKDDKSFDFNRKVEKNTIVFISQQLLHSNKDNSNPDETYTQPLHSLIKLDVRCDNTFVDEVHQYFSPKWKSYFEVITRGRILLASGTAAKIKLQYPDLFDEYNTHTDTLKDLKDRLFREFGIEVITTIKRINVSQLGSEFVNMKNLQSIDENGNLVNPSIGNKFLDNIFKGYRTSPMTPEKISSENPKHCPIYVDTIEFGKLIFQYLINNPQLNIVPILVTGRSKEKTVKGETELKKFIKKQNSDGKSTVMITCGSMIQGVSVEEWKDMINLSVVGTYEMFYQFFGRGWEIDTTKMKGQTIHITMWDYNPHRTLKVAAQFVQSLAMTNGLDIPRAFEYYFQIHNIWDYVSDGNSFRRVNESEIQSEIREYIDSQVLNRGCKARLVTNTRPEVMGDISDELLEIFLNTQGLNPNNNKVKELKSYKNDINKQKTNHSKKSHDLDIPKIPKNIQDLWQSAVDGLSVYTERIPIVTEVMFKEGKLKTKNVTELMGKSQDKSFVRGFGFPSSSISQQFGKYILRHGNLQKINLKVDNSVNLIPIILECLDMNIDEFLKVGDTFDEIYKYGGDNTQLSVRDSYNILKKELKKTKAKVGQKFVVKNAKSGSINLALTYLLKENSKKIFGRELTNKEIIESVSYEDKNTFFESLINTMGFSKTTHTKKDFIIINPPYNDHENIFNKSFEELNYDGVLICIHPSTHFINRKQTSKSSKVQRQLDIVSNYKSRLTLVDGNKIFDAGFFTPLSITRVEKVLDEKIEVVYSHIDSTNTEVKVYDKLDDIFIHGNDIVIGIYNKILSKMTDSVESKLYRNGAVGEYYLDIIRTCGNPPKKGEVRVNPDFYCLVYKRDENNFDKLFIKTPNEKNEQKGGTGFNQISINSKIEGEHLFRYLLTKFSRFCVSLYKMNIQLTSRELDVLPYMDFSQEWTDEKLFDYFELNQEEIEFINTYIQNWYERDFN